MGNPKFATGIKNTIIQFFEQVLKNAFPDFSDLDLKLIKIRNLADYILADIVAEHILAGVEIKINEKVKTVHYKDLVADKNIAFFIDNKETFFDGLPEDKVEYFCDMLIKDESEGGYSKQEKDAIWKYGDIIIKLCEKYKKTP
ncbi:MAG: hypothetical protein JST07_11210 [Bacteroidetes bacterium]|nr:hypothetical protein [Bacteroidota bacterium]